IDVGRAARAAPEREALAEQAARRGDRDEQERRDVAARAHGEREDRERRRDEDQRRPRGEGPSPAREQREEAEGEDPESNLERLRRKGGPPLVDADVARAGDRLE